MAILLLVIGVVAGLGAVLGGLAAGVPVAVALALYPLAGSLAVLAAGGLMLVRAALHPEAVVRPVPARFAGGTAGATAIRETRREHSTLR